METLGELVARDRRAESTALRAPEIDRSYDYRRFCTTAWKVGNLLRHHGVRRGAGVAIADDPSPESVLTLYGAACLGAVARFGRRPPPADAPKAVVAPSNDLPGESRPATTPIGYADPPTDPAVAHFERDVWSENPTAPPDAVDPTDPLLATDRDAATHRRVLDAAESVVERHEIGRETTVAIDTAASLADPGIVVAGLVAPIRAGSTVAIGPGTDGDLSLGGPESDVEVTAVLVET
jgi:hypothetical protein